jgi:hypothetical protein
MAFELTLNPSKTAITPGIKLHDNSWPVRLRQARYRDDSPRHLSGDIIDLFSMAFETASDKTTSGAISYAIKRCNPFPGGSAWEIYERLLLTSATLEPSCLPHVHDVLLFGESVGLPLNRNAIAETMNDLCRTQSDSDHGFEVAWALSILRQLGLPVEPVAGTAVARMSDNYVLLLLLDGWHRSRRLRTAVDIDPVVRRAEAASGFVSDDWLLSYESRVRRWCRSTGWKAAPAWKELRDANVRFLTLTISTRRPRIRRARPAFLTSWPYA